MTELGCSRTLDVVESTYISFKLPAYGSSDQNECPVWSLSRDGNFQDFQDQQGLMLDDRIQDATSHLSNSLR